MQNTLGENLDAHFIPHVKSAAGWRKKCKLIEEKIATSKTLLSEKDRELSIKAVELNEAKVLVDNENRDNDNEINVVAYLRELESKYPINGVQSEDDLQEKIDELEIKLMRSNAVKEELEKQIEDQNKLFRIYNQSCDEAGLVPSREANVKCSQTVIKCYEELSTWHTAQDGKDVFLYD